MHVCSAKIWIAPLTETSADRYPEGAMEVHFTPEQLERLSQIAYHAGVDTEHLVKDAALRLVEEDTKFRAAVGAGIAQADREELIDDEQVRLWLEERERS